MLEVVFELLAGHYHYEYTVLRARPSALLCWRRNHCQPDLLSFLGQDRRAMVDVIGWKRPSSPSSQSLVQTAQPQQHLPWTMLSTGRKSSLYWYPSLALATHIIRNWKIHNTHGNDPYTTVKDIQTHSLHHLTHLSVASIIDQLTLQLYFVLPQLVILPLPSFGETCCVPFDDYHLRSRILPPPHFRMWHGVGEAGTHRSYLSCSITTFHMTSVRGLPSVDVTYILHLLLSFFSILQFIPP